MPEPSSLQAPYGVTFEPMKGYPEQLRPTTRSLAADGVRLMVCVMRDGGALSLTMTGGNVAANTDMAPAVARELAAQLLAAADLSEERRAAR